MDDESFVERELLVGWWDDSVGKSPCCQTWWPEFVPWSPHGARREPTPKVVVWIPCACVYTHTKLVSKGMSCGVIQALRLHLRGRALRQSRVGCPLVQTIQSLSSMGLKGRRSKPATCKSLTITLPTLPILPLGWLSSSVLLLSGTLTCPGRRISSKHACLRGLHLARMHLHPGMLGHGPHIRTGGWLSC